MIKLYHSPGSRSLRVRWLLEELSLPYELVTMEFSPSALRSPEYLGRHPLGQVPAIEDGALVLFESGAILQHILDRYGDGGLLPPIGSDERSLCWQWFHFGEATLARHAGDIVKHRFTLPEPERVQAVVTIARKRLCDSLAVLESALDGREYILGSGFSAADIMLGYALILARRLRELPDDYENVVGYVHRLRSRPALARANA
jgi:glutathione S-transferase